MRIAFAIEHFSPLQGGAERYAWGLAEWLLAQGHELHAFTLPGGPGIDGVTVHALRPAGRGGRQHAFAAALSAALEGSDFDVVHGFNHVWPCDVLRLGGGVHVAFEQFNALSCSSSFGREAKRLAYRTFPRYAALRRNEACQFDDPHRRFIAVSKRVAADMEHYYPACRGRVHVIPNGLDPDRFGIDKVDGRRGAARERFGAGPDELLFLFVSNNYRLKGLYDLLAALPRAADRLARPFRLVVVGREDAGPFQRAAARRGLADRVVFAGQQNDMLGCYGAADALLHPTYYDACANVCLEAVACGLPVLTSVNNGAAELIEGTPGVSIVRMPASGDGLIDAILDVAAQTGDPDVRRALTDRAASLPISRNYEAVLALYDRVASEKKARGAIAP